MASRRGAGLEGVFLTAGQGGRCLQHPGRSDSVLSSWMREQGVLVKKVVSSLGSPAENCAMKRRILLIGSCLLCLCGARGNSGAAETSFDGLGVNLGNLYRVSKARSRSISPENFTGEKGKAGMATEGTGKNAARELGQGWKVSPSVVIKSKKTFTLAEIEGTGAIQSIWMTPTGNWRWSILRLYWDDETTPSIECPVGDFFACGWGKYCQISSMPVCVNPGSAFNCYWQMPFRKRAKEGHLPVAI